MSTKLHPSVIPSDFPVRPLMSDAPVGSLAVCGQCGLSWDDAIPTEYTPAPSARCPFEAFHKEEPPKRKRRRANWKRVEALIARLKDVQSSAIHFKFHSDEYSERRGVIFREALNTRTVYEASYVRGYAAALWDSIWAHTVWRLGTESGPLPEGVQWDYSKGPPTHGGHFWKGTDKPFTSYERLS